MGPEMRRGIAELDGEGEVAGGVIVMRAGKNALETIDAVKAQLAELAKSLPQGVEIVETYDRSGLIERAVRHLRDKLVEEFVVVALVCAIFLFHLRSAFVAIVTLPLGVLIAFIVMHYQGVNANIMSLGGIAIAIGAMVDAAVVMIENAHKKLEAWTHEHPGVPIAPDERWRVIGDAAVEVGPALFFSLLIITLSFVPVFALEAQEGRLFAPLAYTKTYAMAASAGLAVTLIPVLMGYLIRGRIPAERQNPINRFLIAAYRPCLAVVLRWPKATLAVAALVFVATLIPASRLGGEFLPPLYEGDLLYMPSALPGISAAKAAELLQQTDRLIATVPEVKRVFGKVGRAETATDPAPLEMVETTVQLKPREEWRPGMTPEKLVDELDRLVKLPGLANIWIPPIRNRIDMLATGIKSPLGIKVSGNDLAEIERVAADIERRGEGRPRRHLGARRARQRRPLHRRARRPRGRGALRPERRRRAVGGRGRDRRRERRRDDRGPPPLPDQRALPARAARLDREAEDAPDRDRGRGADAARRGRGDRDHRRPADAPQRERAARGLDLRRHPRPRPRVGRARRAARGRRRRRRFPPACRCSGRASSSISSAPRSGSPS